MKNVSKRYIYKTHLYKTWRKKVYKRDGYKCRLCHDTGYLEAHHIRPKAKYPSLTYVVANGITLCKRHHKLVTGVEEKWQNVFYKIIRYNIWDLDQIRSMVEECPMISSDHQF